MVPDAERFRGAAAGADATKRGGLRPRPITARWPRADRARERRLNEPLPDDDALPTLVEAAREGDPDAFRRLARRVEPLLRRWALVRTGDPHRADEVTQDVLLRMHEHLDGFRGEARLETWLYRITMNVAATMDRSRGRPTVPLEAIAGRAPAAAGGEDGEIDDLYAKGVAELVGSFFRELPDRQRQVFDLVELQGRAPKEVARMLDLSPSTVRVTLLHARRALRGRILDLHPELEEGYGRGM